MHELVFLAVLMDFSTGMVLCVPDNGISQSCPLKPATSCLSFNPYYFHLLCLFLYCCFLLEMRDLYYSLHFNYYCLSHSYFVCTSQKDSLGLSNDIFCAGLWGNKTDVIFFKSLLFLNAVWSTESSFYLFPFFLSSFIKGTHKSISTRWHLSTFHYSAMFQDFTFHRCVQ